MIGEVMGFILGMTRGEVRRQMLARTESAYLQNNCSGINSPALTPVGGDTLLFQQVTASDDVCVHSRDRRLMLMLEFAKDRLSKVKMHVIHTELI